VYDVPVSIRDFVFWVGSDSVTDKNYESDIDPNAQWHGFTVHSAGCLIST